MGPKVLAIAFLIFLIFAAQALWSDLATLRLHTASPVEASIFLLLDSGLALTALAAIAALVKTWPWAPLAVGAWFVMAAAFLCSIWWFLPPAVDRMPGRLGIALLVLAVAGGLLARSLLRAAHRIQP
jgi:hypothetical protein